MDGVSVESTYVMMEIYDFLEGKSRHLVHIDNKNNINNYRYQIIWGNFIFLLEKLWLMFIYCSKTKYILI